jgi:hypothetical protein
MTRPCGGFLLPEIIGRKLRKLITKEQKGTYVMVSCQLIFQALI